MVVLAVFTHELAIEEKRLISPELLEPYRKIRNSMLTSACLFLATMFPQFWFWRIQDVPLRFYLWLIPLAVFWIERSLEGSPRPRQKHL
jgi:glycopeptide antibiotics resistance protein